MLTLHEVRRSLGNWLAITRGRLRGRTYAPHPRRAIYMETSGRCNLACRFCAYDRAGSEQLMKLDLFRSTLGQVVDMGFDFVYLTPSLGEFFADPTLFAKLDLLESEPQIRGYGFFSNFILADEEDIHRLTRLSKLHSLSISLYGFDEDPFVLTTRKPAKQFHRLLRNLQTLLDVTARWNPAGGLHFNARTIRTGRPFLQQPTPLVETLQRLLLRQGTHFDESEEYDNWGGVIKNADVPPLGIALTDGRHLYMRGACTKLFGEVQIKADGTVHACACRDTDGSLRIGQLGSSPLDRILSWDNPVYRGLIEEQMRGRFGANCRSCSSYRSVFDDRASRLDPKLDVMSVDKAITHLTTGPERQGQDRPGGDRGH